MAGPRILLIHGFMSGRVAWRPLRREVHEDVVFITPDLPGYGRQPPPDTAAGYTLDAIVDFVEPLVDRHQPTHVAGHSMGAIIALALAARRPDAFQKVGLIGLPVFSDRADGHAFIRQRGRVQDLFLRSDRLAHAIACRALYRSRWAWSPFAPAILPGYPVSHLRATFDHSAAGHAGGLDGIVFGGFVPGLAQRVTIPVAALHGALDTAAPPERIGALAEDRGWDLAVARHADHQLPIIRPKIAARWLRERLLLRPVAPDSTPLQSEVRTRDRT